MINKLKQLIVVFAMIVFSSSVFSDEKNKGLNIYTGMFDFSDDGKKSNLFGIQHINDDLYRETSFGTLQPVTGCKVPK